MFMNPNPYAPEDLCAPIEYSYQDLIDAQKFSSTIRVFVSRYIKAGRFLAVNIPGVNISGYIPLEEASIYPLLKPNCEISPAIYSLIGKLVSCKILDLEKKLLSRRANMLEAYNTLSKQETLETILITSLSQHNAYVDVGAGIQGKIHISEISKCRFDSLADLGTIFPGQILSAKVLSIDEFKRFELSYRATSKESLDDFSEGDIVRCKVGSVLEDSPTGFGYFVYVSPNVSGIVDSSDPLYYTEEIVGVIHKVTPKGLRISFLSK